MSFQFIDADGNVTTVSADEGPFQYTSEGFNTGLAVNSRPYAEYFAGARTYKLLYDRQPMVRACVEKLVTQIQRLPLKVYKGKSPDKERIQEGGLYDAIGKPMLRKSEVALKQWMARPLLVHGAAALRILRRNPGGPPTGFKPLFWQFLEARTIDGVQDGEPDYYRYTLPNEKPEVIQVEDVLLIAPETLDGTVGSSPLKPLLDTLRIEAAVRKYTEYLLLNGVRPSGGVSFGGDSNDAMIKLFADAEFRERFEERLMQLNGGIENAGKPLLLPPGAKWQDFAKSMSDAEIIAHRKIGREEVCAVYDMDPALMGVGDNVGESALAVLFPSLFQTTLPPYLTLIQGSFRAQVIDPHPAYVGQWVEFDLRDVLRGSPQDEANARKTDLMSGVMTINEARSGMNLPPINHPDANRPMIPTNNVIFLGDSPTRNPSTEGQAAAVLSNLDRAADRVARRLKAGATVADAWDAERFERELRDDLTAAGANGTAAQAAAAWTAAFGGLIAQTADDPDALRSTVALCATPALLAAGTPDHEEAE